MVIERDGCISSPACSRYQTPKNALQVLSISIVKRIPSICTTGYRDVFNGTTVFVLSNDVTLFGASTF